MHVRGWKCVLNLLIISLSFVVLQSAAAQTSISFIQSNSATPQSATNPVTVTYAGAQTASNLNVVVVGWNDSTTTVSSVTDSSGNTYTLAVGPTVQSGTATQAIYYAKNISAAAANANTVTVTFSVAPTFPDIRIAEYKGLDVTNPLDVTAAAQGNSATSDSGAVTTTNANDLIIGANVVQSTTQGAGSGYTSRVITADGDILEDETVTSTGSYDATATLDKTQPWIMQLVAFRAAAVGPSISSLSTSFGAVGLSVTVTGTNFGSAQGGSTVTFNGVAATAITWSATSISVQVPSGATTGNVVVTVGGTPSNGASFAVVAPPTISALTSPSPNAAGWDNLNVTVSFTCTAGGLAIASCSSPQTVSSDGANQVVTGTVTDTSGDTATASATINLDKTPPTLSISSPADGSSTSSSTVTVSGTLSDSLSGTSGVTCNGTSTPLTSGSFSCNISLNVGVNLIVVRGTDIAGNVSADALHVTLTGSLPTPTSMQVTPSGGNLVVGGTQQFTAVDDQGRPRTDASWSVDNTSVGTIDTASSPTLTSLATGTVTLTATIGSVSASAAIHVLSGTSLPDGTVQWSAPVASNHTSHQVVQAQVTATSPDLYSIEWDSSDNTFVRAFSVDGQQLWASTPGGLVGQGTPDGNGGLVLTLATTSAESRVIDLDAETGTPIWEYDTNSNLSGSALAQDGGVILTENTTSNPTVASIVRLDPMTGAATPVFTVPNSNTETIIDGCSGAPSQTSTPSLLRNTPSIGPDGSVLEILETENLVYTHVCGEANGFAFVSYVGTLSLITIPAGGSDTPVVTPFRTLTTPIDTGQTDMYGNELYDFPNVASADTVIPDGQGGFLVPWYIPNLSNQGHITHIISSSSISDFTPSSIGAPTQLVLGDNGTAYVNDPDNNRVVAFGVSDGSPAWTYTAPSNAYPTIVASASGGGMTAKLTDSSNVDTIIRFDSSGTATTDSWSASGLGYYISNDWPGFPASGGAMAMYSASPVQLAAADWFMPAQRGLQRARPVITMSGFSQAGPNQTFAAGWVSEILTALSINSFPGGTFCLAWLQTGSQGANTLSNLQGFLNATPSGWGHATILTGGRAAYANGAVTPAPPAAPGQPSAGSGVLTVVNDVGPFFNSTFPGGTLGVTYIAKYLPNTPRAKAQFLVHEMAHELLLPSFLDDNGDTPALLYNDGLVITNCRQLIEALPGITSVSPASGRAGVASVTITGANFGASPGSSTVTFNGTAATLTPANWNATSVTVTVPAGATTGNIVVTVSGVPTTGPVFTVAP